MRAIVQTGMISIALALLPLLLTMGCANTPDAELEGPAAPVLDTPSNVPERLLVNTPKPILALRIDARQYTRASLARSRSTRTTSSSPAAMS